MTLILLVLLALIIVRALYWIREGRRLRTTPGYVVPNVGWLAAKTQWLLSTLACRVLTGPVRFYRSDKIDLFNGRVIAVVNHQIMRDIPVLLKVGTRRRWRYMSAVEQVTRLKSWYFAWTGCVAVVREDKAKAQMAQESAIEGLVRDRNAAFGIFPQRRLVADNEINGEHVRPGGINIGREVQKRTGEKVAVIPVYIHYHETPRGLFSLPWLRNLRTVRVHMKDKNLVERKWVTRYVYGATVIAGDPIAVDDLPTTPREAGEVIAAKWLEMKARCEAEARPSPLPHPAA